MKIIVQRIMGDREVTAFASDDVIGAEMELDAFLSVLFSVSGISDSGLREKLLAGAPKVLSLMKQQTTKVIL